MTRIAVVSPFLCALVLVAHEAGRIVAEPATPLDRRPTMEDAYWLVDQVGVMFVLIFIVSGQISTVLGVALI